MDEREAYRTRSAPFAQRGDHHIEFDIKLDLDLDIAWLDSRRIGSVHHGTNHLRRLDAGSLTTLTTW